MAIAASHYADGAPVHRRTHRKTGVGAEPDSGAFRGDLRRPTLGRHPGWFLTDLFRELIVPTLLPIVVLLPATAAFGNELEDGTLPYLLMKPVSRLRLVLGKYAAVMLVTVPALLVGLVVTTLIAAQGPEAGDLGDPGGDGWRVGCRGGVAGRGLLLVSLIVPRALLAGMIYIFAWESLLGRFLPGVRAISSREYALRVFDGLLTTTSRCLERGADHAGRCRCLPAVRRVAAAQHQDRLSSDPKVIYVIKVMNFWGIGQRNGGGKNAG